LHKEYGFNKIQNLTPIKLCFISPLLALVEGLGVRQITGSGSFFVTDQNLYKLEVTEYSFALIHDENLS
jgi:hypothetical protein